MKRNIYTGAGILALAALLATSSVLVSKRNIVQAGGVMAPKFEVDPFWPKALPNHWVIGQTIGLSIDSNDNVWIIHRPGSLEPKESYLKTNSAECCIAAPDVLEFDPAGNVLHHFGKVEGHDWPSSNHGITVDNKGNVWIGGNGTGRGHNPRRNLAPRERCPAPQQASTLPKRVWHEGPRSTTTALS